MTYNVPLPRLLDSSAMNEVRRLNPVTASVSISLLPLSTASLTLQKSEEIAPRSFVEIFTSAGSAGIFRARSPETNYGDDEVTVQFDHAICEIGDYIIKGKVKFDAPAPNVFSQIMSHYGGSLWRLGTVSATDNIKASSDYGNVLQTMCEVLELLPGYMMTFDQTVRPWTVNIVKRPETVTAEGRLTRNVLSAIITEDDTELCTRVYMKKLPNGYMDADTIGQYGLVERRIEGDDALTATEAQKIAREYLEARKTPMLSVSIDLQDLSQATGESLDSVSAGELFRLAMPDYGVTQVQMVTNLDWPDVYRQPGLVTVTLANETDSLTSVTSSLQLQMAKVTNNYYRLVEEVELKASNEYVENLYEILDEAQIAIDEYGVNISALHSEYDILSGRSQELAAELSVQADAITSEVTRATQAEGEIGSRITQTAEEVRSEVYASNSQLYSVFQQTASSITSAIENTEQGLYSYIQQTASGLRQTFMSTSNRTWVQDNDPRSETGGENTPKVGDIWIESTHQGTWDGANGFDWEHDENYDWTQVQGAKVWTWQNDQWELVADRQQLVTYSDFVNTAEILISQKISGIVNDEGLLDVYMSKIEQTGTEIRSEIYRVTSDIYSFIDQTASNITQGVSNHPTTVVQDQIANGKPAKVNGRDPVENDIWIDTANQKTWDAALATNWADDIDYNWNDLRSDKIYVYRDGEWQEAIDGTVLLEETFREETDSHFADVAREIKVVDGKATEYYSKSQQEAERIYNVIQDRTNDLGSRVEQTASQIRSELHASQSRAYSEIVQTASNILLHVENEISDVGASIEVTANQIRSEVHAADSKIYSSITQTASQIRSEVSNSVSGLQSQITQNANSITLKASQSSVDSLGRRVTTAESTLTVQAEQISSKVSAGNIASTINQTAQSVLIQASKINLSGYVTASELQAEIADIEQSFANLVITDYMGAAEAQISRLDAVNTQTSYLGVGAYSASWMSQTVITAVNSTTVNIRDYDGDRVSFRALSANTPTSSKTIYYLGRTAS